MPTHDSRFKAPGEMLHDIGAAAADATAAFQPQPQGSATHAEPGHVGHQDLSYLTPSSQPGHLVGEHTAPPSRIGVHGGAGRRHEGRSSGRAAGEVHGAPVA